MFLTAGAKLDRYEVVAPLAVGGMAELYLARSRGIEGFEKLCVLKRILPQHARDPDFVHMFLDEARLAATLLHPNVVSVYDIGLADGRYYFAMEYVHGQDLGAIVAAARERGRGLKLEHSIAIAAAVAAGLHHAHEQRDSSGTPLRIVHRDVSPTNILVSYDGHVKVTDFGIAKAAARRTQTTVGTAKGKLSYMSPEQVRADRTLDRRSDVFSLAIVLYELTTGTALFRGASDFLVAEQILEGTITPPRSIRASYPASLEAIVMKGLARDPAARYTTARELQLALEELARTEQLRSSSAGLADLMRDLFPAQAQAWKRASTEGFSLVDHVVKVVTPGPMPAARAAEPHAQAQAVAPTGSRSRWLWVVAIVGVCAAIAGWVVVLVRSEPGGAAPAPVRAAAPLDDAAMSRPDASEVALPAPLPDAAPMIAPTEVVLVPDAGVGDGTHTRTNTRRTSRSTAAPDAGVRTTEPLDDRLNPFKPPPEQR